jgi:hypothetical protein
VRRILKWTLVAVAVPLGLVVALATYAICADLLRFHLAKSDCERNCLQDSGGLFECREVCRHHPNHYDNP